ncbi:membrane protein [Rhodanobacter panaciterrae]|uniref:Membrane protein n=1 Tax=Rhodanobacter panaciterrae TaxID=490572 RepID=A0ABQ2ZVP7_9GAMM|nr:anti-sigma factor [Rhodanobacter panaciterrae]GGY23907.1 membrane protein [Rhodanobacter panaciterrae]
MTCDDTRLLMHAYLDDELDAAQSAVMARHLQECTSCTANYGVYSRLRKALAQPGLYHRAPDALRERWSPAPSAAQATLPASSQPRRAPLAYAMAAGFAGALLLTSPAWITALQQRGADSNPVVAEAISSHIRSLQAQHLMDVVSTDQHTVKPWFEGKLDFSPRVKDLVSEGFPLIGGRLDAIDGRSVAALIYKRHLHVINLYQWPADSAATAQAEVQRHGYTVIRWTAEGMRYVAISDVSAGDLKQFVLAFQNDAGTPAVNPSR